MTNRLSEPLKIDVHCFERDDIKRQYSEASIGQGCIIFEPVFLYVDDYEVGCERNNGLNLRVLCSADMMKIGTLTIFRARNWRDAPCT